MDVASLTSRGRYFMAKMILAPPVLILIHILGNPLDHRWVSRATGVETEAVGIPVSDSYKSSGYFDHKRFLLRTIEDCEQHLGLEVY